MVFQHVLGFIVDPVQLQCICLGTVAIKRERSIIQQDTTLVKIHDDSLSIWLGINCS